MRKNKLEIRNMFVSMIPNYGEEKGCIYDMAILTPTDGYVEYELRFCHSGMTYVAFETLKSLLVDYRFTDKSEVCMTDSVPMKNPIQMYLSILAQQIGFRIYRASVKKISDRLCGVISAIKHRISTGGKQDRTHIGTIWNYLIRSKKCKWITPAYDQYISGLSNQRKRRKKFVRIGAYYMRIRRLKYQYTLRSKLRAAEMRMTSIN